MSTTFDIPAAQLPAAPRVRWIVMSSPETGQSFAPRFRLLTGPVELEYDVADTPTRTLVTATEAPEVI